MRPACGCNLQRLGPVLGGEDLVALAHEVVTHEFKDVDLVVDQQDAVAHRFGFGFGGADGVLRCGPFRVSSAKIANFPLNRSVTPEK